MEGFNSVYYYKPYISYNWLPGNQSHSDTSAEVSRRTVRRTVPNCQDTSAQVPITACRWPFFQWLFVRTPSSTLSSIYYYQWFQIRYFLRPLLFSRRSCVMTRISYSHDGRARYICRLFSWRSCIMTRIFYSHDGRDGRTRNIYWLFSRVLLYKSSLFYCFINNVGFVYNVGYQYLSLIHIWRCRRSTLCRSRWSPYH